jgi:hypothetical protein
MKFSATLISSLLAAASAAEISTTSKIGQTLMSKARRVEQNGDDGDQSWMANYSMKFQGCKHVSQWNADAEDAEDVRIESMRLAIFKLCPTDSCSASNSRGCNNGYGEYVVDMDEFLPAYLENKQEVQEANCENYLTYNCNCGDDDKQDDNFNAEYCEAQCFNNAGMSECVDADSGYYQGDNSGFELENYLQCSQYQQQDNGRRLDGGYYEEEEQEYYMGTYCSDSGGSVVVGMFTDDACTVFADSNGGRSTYFQNEGVSMPYSEDSIVENECMTCEEAVEDNGNGYYYAPETKEMCTDIYNEAGKCESAMSSDDNANINENACSYLEGIKTVGASGIINSGNGGANKVASAFISIFGVSFVLLGSYVYYLKTKLDRGRINLSD